jgi:hypothetical protein
MTQKAQNILNRIREKDWRERVLARLRDSQRRSRTMDSIHRLDQDEPIQVGGGDQEIKVL